MVAVGPLLAVLLKLAGVFGEACLAQLEDFVAVLEGREAFLSRALEGLLGLE